MSTYIPIYCFKCAQDTVRHGTSVIEWCCLYTQICTGNTGSFAVLEHKTKYLFLACQNIVVYLFQSSFTVTHVSMLQFTQVNINSVICYSSKLWRHIARCIMSYA